MVEVLTASCPLVECLSKGQCVVAKLYDPMYIDDDNLYINLFLVANKDYTNETAAYKALSDFQGSKIPRYYGSYSLDIPLEPSAKRSVRLILIEAIPGSSMLNSDPHALSQQARQNITKSIIEFNSSVYAKGIILGDLHQRNVMLTATTRVVVIDFGDVRFGWLGFYSDIPEVSQ